MRPSRFAVDGGPIGRFYCHCTICQEFNRSPYADVTAFPARAVALPEDSAVKFRRYRPPLAIDRGSCAACGGPVLEFMALGPLKMFAFVSSQNFERPSELPEPSLQSTPRRRDGFASEGERVLGERNVRFQIDPRRFGADKAGRIDFVQRGVVLRADFGQKRSRPRTDGFRRVSLSAAQRTATRQYRGRRLDQAT
jgi:hypothetical protein